MVAVRLHATTLLAALLCCSVPTASADEILTYEEAVSRALSANHELLQQADRTLLAELDLEAAQDQLTPQFSMYMNSDARSGAEVGRQSGVVMDRQFASGSNLGVGVYSSTFGSRSLTELAFSYRLPFFGSRGAEIRRSLDDADFSTSQEYTRLRLTELEVRREVLVRYYDVVLAIIQLDLADRAADISRRIAIATEIRLVNDQQSQLEMQRARIATERSEQGRTRARRALENAQDLLRVSIGAELDETLLIETSSPSSLDIDILEWPLEELLARASNERIEIIEAARAVSSVERLIREDKPGLLPNIEVSLQYSLIEDSGFPHDYHDDQRLGLGIRMNSNFDLQNRDQTAMRRQIDLEQRKRAYDRTRQMVELDVKRAHAQAEDSAQQLRLARAAMDLTEMEYERAAIIVEAEGDLSQIDLLLLQQQHEEARHQVRASEVLYAAALQDLRLAAGGRAP